MFTRSRSVVTCALTCALLACGGGAEPTATGTPPTTAPSVATTISLSTSKLNFASLGETQSLSATVKDQHGQTMSGASVAWTSSNAAVAAVSGSGSVAAVSNGTATITAASGSLSATVTVTVAQVAASLTFSESRIAFDSVNKTHTVAVSVRDARQNAITGPAITWTSSDSTVATVTSAGAVTSKAAGTAVLTATSGALSGTIGVTVNAWGPLDAQVIATMQGAVKNFPDSYIVQWALADFNHDGNDDLAVSGWSACGGAVGCHTGASINPPGPLHLFERATDGRMQDVSQQFLGGAVTAYTNVPVATDLNNDGVTDLFLGGFTDDPPTSAPSKYLVSGAGGTFTVRNDATPVWAHGAMAYDLNGDGCQDILVGDNTAPVWRGDCSGNLTRTTFGGVSPVPLSGASGLHVDGAGWAMGMCVADFNGDGKLDVAYTDAIVRNAAQEKSPQNNVILEVDWTKSQPAITAAHALPLPVLDRNTAVGSERSHDMRCVAADLDGDGDADLFISSTRWPDDNVSWGGSQFQVYLNDGNFSFRDVSDAAFAGRSTQMAFGFNPIIRDLNGDGIPDLFFTGRSPDSTVPLNPAWLGNGDGTFRQSTAVNVAALRQQALDVVNTYAALPDWAKTTTVDEIAPVRRATGEYDFVVTHMATDNVPVSGSPYGTPTIFVVFIPAGVRF